MGFKANIDIALSFSSLKICSVRQQGRIKFKVCLYYTYPTINGKQVIEEVHYCHPYSIQKKNNEPKNKSNLGRNHQMMGNYYVDKYKTNNPFIFPVEESELDMSSDYYVSKPFKIMFQRQYHFILETCCFRTYVDIEKYSDINLKCQVQLMFCPNAVSQQNAVFKTIGKCQCKIRKLFDVSTYLPIVFDQFEGVVIQGVYQAALIDFRYERQQTQIDPQKNPQNFHQYLKLMTNAFNRTEVRNFYKYYRQLLQKQLFTIQERHYDLLRVLGINSSLEQFRILRINPNLKIQSMIDNLAGYSSQKISYSLAHQRSNEYNKYESMATNVGDSSYSNRIIKKGNQLNTSNQLRQSLSPKQQISQQIIYDFLGIKAHLFKKWSQFLDFTTKNISAISQKYKTTYNSLVKQRLSSNVFSHKVNIIDWRKAAYQDSGNEHLKQTWTERQKVQKDQQMWKQSFIIQNQGFFVKDSKNIKIFEEIYTVNHQVGKNNRSQRTLRRSLQKNGKNYGVQPVQKKSLTNIQKSLFQLGNRKGSLPPNLNALNGLRNMQQRIQGIQMMVSYASGSNQYDDNQDHFIVLVHGFQASRQDFIVLKNCLQIRFKTKVFISTCNQGRTEDDIQTQGKRLAVQLQRYLLENKPSLNYKLSFVGHSMGGIVIRTALCWLENVGEHLHSYISLSTPHLGYLYQPSTHIQAGLWLMSTLQKTNSIEQICVRDKQDLRNTFLYRLSLSKSLDKFKNMAFVGSCQDKYVPYQSSRVQNNQYIIKNSLSTYNGIIIGQMIQGILGTIQCKELSRMDVIFNIQQNNFDSMIGRTAHIRYLSDRQFIKVFCIVFDKFFK